MSKNNSMVRRGLLISKTVIYKMLIRRAGGFLSNPGRLKTLMSNAVEKLKKNEGVGALSMEIVGSFLILVDLIKDVYNKRFPMNKKRVIMIVGAIIYFVTPVDIIPDVIPVLGFLDDASLLAWLFYALKEEIASYITWRNVINERKDEFTYDEVYELSQRLEVDGRSTMTKDELTNAIKALSSSHNA